MTFDLWLQNELRLDAEQELTRELRVLPAGTVLFSTNDYLGLSSHRKVREAALAALDDAPVGARAARTLSGNQFPHALLEEKIAALKHSARALLFTSGYAAACGTLPSLAGPGDTVILDKKAHACLLDGARLSGATLRVFEHNQPGHLEDICRWTREKEAGARILIVVESVYSMDGDTAPLSAICDIKERYGAWLMVDEAHATGVFGAEGRGLCNEPQIQGRVEVQMGTLGKALGTAGGFITGSNALIELLVNRARSFLFTTAPPPALAAAAAAAVDLVLSKEGHELRLRLARHLEQLLHALPALKIHSPIVPVPVGQEAEATRWSETLLEKGIYVPAVRSPTVAKGDARLRISLTAAHREEDILSLASHLRPLMGSSGKP
ncbi:MAG: 8-amino-7-oxononanoate synthase [Candidatus Methylacidiphilales bacterium]|nr:8-amino-7-oxononanoate synthase [Candidatus Methylacidiphilales bacterium]